MPGVRQGGVVAMTEYINTDGAGVYRVESISTDEIDGFKEELKAAYIQGYKQGKHVEEVDGVSIRAAEDRFEQWFSLNHE